MKKYSKHNTKSSSNFLKNFNKIGTYLKKIGIRKILLIAFLIISIVFATITFLKFTVFISVDGSWYYNYLKYFRGEASLGEWNTTRGFSFPLIIYFITSLFGDNVNGIVFGFYLFYLGLIIISMKLLNAIIKENKMEKGQIRYWIVYIALFMFNPLIIGYSHTLLTEAVMPFFYMLGIYLNYKWNEITFKNNRKKFIIYSILLILLGIFIWFIKQPYAPAYWIMIFITGVLSGIHFNNIKYFFEKIIVFVLCLIFTFIAIFAWDKILEFNGHTADNTNSSILSGSLVGYYYHYHPIDQTTYCNDNYVNSANFSQNIRSKLLNMSQENKDWCQNVKVYEIYGIRGNYIESDAILDKTSMFDNLAFLLNSIVKHPILVIHSYYENYLGIIDLENTDISKFIPYGYIDSGVYRENSGIGYAVFNPNINNYWWGDGELEKVYPIVKEYSDYMKKYESNTGDKNAISAVMRILEDGSNITFKVFLLVCLPIFIYSLIMYIKYRESKSYLLICLLSGSAFTDIAFNAVMSAIIDRYAYPVYPLMILCIIILFMGKGELKKLDK